MKTITTFFSLILFVSTCFGQQDLFKPIPPLHHEISEKYRGLYHNTNAKEQIDVNDVTILTIGPFDISDVTILTIGLSEEYASRFKNKDHKITFVNLLNKLEVIPDIAPILIKVFYENGKGDVIVEINYDNEKVFSGNNKFNTMNNKQAWLGQINGGKGMSVYLQELIFTAIMGYLYSVAKKDNYIIESDILEFTSTIKLIKANGDWLCFSAYNYLDPGRYYQPAHSIYSNVYMSIRRKMYEMRTDNAYVLNESAYFVVPKIVGMDGKKTGAYYFCKFFGIDVNKN